MSAATSPVLAKHWQSDGSDQRAASELPNTAKRVSNRESARRFRQRRKQYVELLETQVLDLRRDNQELRALLAAHFQLQGLPLPEIVTRAQTIPSGALPSSTQAAAKAKRPKLTPPVVPIANNPQAPELTSGGVEEQEKDHERSQHSSDSGSSSPLETLALAATSHATQQRHENPLLPTPSKASAVMLPETTGSNASSTQLQTDSQSIPSQLPSTMQVPSRMLPMMNPMAMQAMMMAPYMQLMMSQHMQQTRSSVSQ
eukprot:m.71379 g.71379  ORF g.71379 m.71379 type:complete len:257 (+) comp14211_c0_seq1:323-1093(+)